MPREDKRENQIAIIVLIVVLALMSFANWWDEHDRLKAQEEVNQRYISNILLGGKP